MTSRQRRHFLIASGATLAAFSTTAFAQQPAKVHRIAGMLLGSEGGQKLGVDGFLDGMRERGMLVNRNFTIEFRYVSKPDDLDTFADELVALKPDVLVASELSAVWLKARTATTPIVLLTSADPVNAGLAKSLARPGANVTGMASLWHPVAQKQIDFLTEIVPGMARLALLASTYNPPKNTPYYGRPDAWEVAVRRAAEEKKLSVFVHRPGTQDELRSAFAAIREQRAQALLVTAEPQVFGLIRDEVQRLTVASASGDVWFVENGGLLSYGPNRRELYRYASRFVDLILKGAKPADLPIEQPIRFDLIVNLKTAKALGLKVPQSLLLRADRVIE